MSETRINYWAETTSVYGKWIYGPLGSDRSLWQWYIDRGCLIRKTTEVIERTDETLFAPSEPIVKWDGTAILEPRKRSVEAVSA